MPAAAKIELLVPCLPLSSINGVVDYETGIESLTQHSGVWAHGGTPPTSLSTLIHFCRFHAAGKNADAPAFTHVVGQPGEHERLSFADLDRRARSIAAEIQRRGGEGKPVLIVLDPGADYAASLFGCLYARAIAVPIYPPQMLRLQTTLSRLEAVIANAGAALMLSDRKTIGDSLGSLWRMPHQAAIAVDEIDGSSAALWDGQMPQPDDVAVLQYTSGSTGNPRGVILTHRILLSNMHAVIQHVHFEGARSVQWVPPYHDMGLIGGILLPIYRGIETVIISPTDFVRDPLLWLRCIDHYDGTSNGAPNFGYELCVRRIEHANCEGLDLSSWKVAIAGAEPVRANTMSRFVEKFERYGFEPSAFCPSYGMAETTVMATGTRLGQPYRTFDVDTQALQLGHVVVKSTDQDDEVTEPSGIKRHAKTHVKTLVGSGTPVEGIEYEIVDPQSCTPLPDGRIGEIWVRGSSVAAGYWNDPEATERTFAAQLHSPVHSPVYSPVNSPVNSNGCTCVNTNARYLRTGDLAARVDGELIVTGRLKELIIVAGRNFYPHDIEQIVQSTSEAFKPDTGTVIGVDVDDSEQMVVIQEFSRPKKFDPESLLQTVVAAIVENANVTPHAVVFVRSGSLPKTSSGKLRRTDTREMFLRGELTEIARWQSGETNTQEPKPFEPPATPTETKIAELWSRLLNVSPIGRDDDFFHLGGVSLLTAEMLVEIGEIYSVSIPMTTLFRQPTLKAFATAVEAETRSYAAKTNDSADVAQLAHGIVHSGRSLSQSHPLSSAQQRFWLLDQLGQTNAFVHVPVTITLDREIEVATLQKALDNVIARHPMLRTRFVQTDGVDGRGIGAGIEQWIDETARIEIQQFLEYHDAPRREETLYHDAERRDTLYEPMDLSQSPLMRVVVSTTSSGGGRIDLVLHHLVCDAASLQTILHDLASELGCENKTDNDEQRQDTALRYVDFAAWDQSTIQSERVHSRIEYWRERLDGMSPEINLPRFATPHSEKHDDAPVSHTIPFPLAESIRQLALQHSLTPSMVYLTAFQSVLARYAGTNDFGITIPTSNRPASSLQNLVGCFVNPIIYRAGVENEQPIATALAQTRDRLLADWEHADVPFQDVVSATGQARDVSRMPLSQVMFLYQTPIKPIDRLGEARVASVRPGYSAVTAYDVSLVVEPSEQTELTMVAGDSISRTLTESMMASMIETLSEIVEHHAAPFTISELCIPASAERLSIESSSHGRLMQCDDTLVSRIRTLAAESGDSIAIDDDNSSINYRELDRLSDRFATALIAEGITKAEITKDSLVGIEMSRSVNALVAILGVWKSAAAYVPIDPTLPAYRREQIRSAAGLSLVIDDEQFDRMIESIGSTDPTTTRSPLASDLAYVMFTSGSTGVPKGVAIEHGSVANLLASFATDLRFTRDDSMLAVTTISFDISVLEMLLPLWCGGRVAMTAHRIAVEPEAVTRSIERFMPTVIQSTPSAFRMLLSTGWRPSPSTRLLCGGEPLLPDLAGDLLAATDELWNVYGPTETTVWSTLARVESPDAITIGRPIANTICRVFDADGRVCPVGVAGELHIGGLGVARGYLGDDEQTRDRFVVDSTDRFYRTGDQVRWLPTGELEFLARNDRQVKLRGFRVELDEIESALQQCDGVDRAAVVIDRNDFAGGDRLFAFCSGKGDCESTIAQLTARLPDYMLPASILWLDDLPQTPAGKTDYRSLPMDQVSPSPAITSPPQTPLEIALAEAWCEVLELPNVGRDDHFFNLGGNSLMAAQLFGRIRQRFDVTLPLREIYSRPTIALLADAIVEHRAKTEAEDLAKMLEQLDSLSDDEALRVLETNEPS